MLSGTCNATVFPGKDGILGTTDDVRPYNNILQQQTTINKSGVPFIIAPDIYPEASLVSSSVTGNSVLITVGIINKGDAAIAPPVVYATLYKSGSEDRKQLESTDEPRIWAAKDERYIQTTKVSSMVRIYTTEGILHHQQQILHSGETKVRLSRGFYVVTLDDGIGKIVSIE